MDQKTGIVYLVGAGPGDPGLITVRGAECLAMADVVVYDNLANPLLLDYAPAHAERIYAGKKAERHIKTQDEINALLVDRARAGLTVVRLKGGDPFLFGRGGEEAGVLVENGIAWEVVPGVSSALAVPAYAGIPVTHRLVNGSLHVVTGHESDSSDGPVIDWSTLARSRGTIVILMGVKNLPMITGELIRNGLAPDTPVALIRRGTLAEQHTLVTRLDRAAEDAAAAGVKPPAIIVIGQVVRLREQLAWVEQRPLFRMRIAVTRPVDENRTLAAALASRGAEVFSSPTLKLQALPVDDAARKILAELASGAFDWLAITSGNGVRQFVRMLLDANMDLRALARSRVAVIGTRTAEALKQFGIAADLIAEESTQEGLAAELARAGARQVLVARATWARPDLEKQLADAGAKTTILPVYETVPDATGIRHLIGALQQNRLQMITFTSARTFEALWDAAGTALPELLRGAGVAVIGPVTRSAVERAGLHVDVESPRAEMESLAQAIAYWTKGRREG